MKKIVIITEQLYGGGVERILQIICNHFDYSKYEVTIYTVRRDIPSFTIYPPNITFKYVFNSSDGNSSWWYKLRCRFENKVKLFFYYNFSPSIFYQLFIRKKADVAIAFIEGYATRMVSGFPSPIKKIAWLHIELKTFHWSKIAYRSIVDEKNAYISMDKVVCVSKVVKQQLDQLFPVSEKSIVLYNPIDTALIIKSSQIPLDNNLAVSNGRTRLVTIGTLNERKGHLRLLRSFYKLYKENHNLELWIIGDGEKHDELSKFIGESGLSDRAFLLGFKDNPFNYLRECNLYVCSSYAEGYNTAITESLILGIPVVSTECSGVKEQLGENNEWGICVPNSEEGLYNGLKQMLESDTLKYYTKQASIRGRDFTLEKSMDEIYQLLEK